MVPVSIRTGQETEKWTNRVSAITAPLPTNEADPVRRVHQVHESMMSAKQLFDAVPADSLTDFTQFVPPAVFTQAMRTSTRLSARSGGATNLVISNVPGPRTPLYAAGSKLLHYYPVSTIVDGQGLNITVQSYLDSLDFGLVGCRELVPDIWDLLDDIIDDIVTLGAAVGVDVKIPARGDAVDRRPRASARAARSAVKRSPAAVRSPRSGTSAKKSGGSGATKASGKKSSASKRAARPARAAS
jgi:hypothetical protein